MSSKQPLGELYEVIVVGAGHAGCEAALAASRLGCRTLLLTMKLENAALMPCNPSIGGPAKGHLVREIDALGGEMAHCIDRTFIQIRLLNTGKGPAVQALRAQADKALYARTMRATLEQQPRLSLREALVEDLETGQRCGEHPLLRLVAHDGSIYRACTVVLTTGTSLRGRVVVGDRVRPAGRAGEAPAVALSAALRRLSFELGRLKTGTPPRVHAASIDFARARAEQGSSAPLYFSFAHMEGEAVAELPQLFREQPCPLYPKTEPSAWRPQLPCYLVHTNPCTHEVIRANLHRAPLFSGLIEGVGPRHCPSIEDKVVRFAQRESHPIFLEPEGWQSEEVYVQGASTSLPEDVQLAMLRSIPALERAEVVHFGYAVEYDYVLPHQTRASLESRRLPGLFFAGQINGTSGYEEAAAQGLLAGINAARFVQGRAPLLLRRDQAYIGVMIDDLVTREHREPYRMLTSRAEHRLLLRQDDADLRLTPIGYELGLVPRERLEAVERRRHAVQREKERLGELRMAWLPWYEGSGASASDYLRRPGVSYHFIEAVFPPPQPLTPLAKGLVEAEVKYEGYIRRQREQVERLRRLEGRGIPEDFLYQDLPALSRQAREALARFRPATLGQASRIAGVTPADLAILAVLLERRSRGSVMAPTQSARQLATAAGG